jgi:hypothetical protein
LREAHDFPSAGNQLCDLDRGFVRLAARRKQHYLRQARHLPRQPLSKLQNGRAQHRGKQMIEAADRVAYDGDDFRMAVAKDGAHLSRGEVKDAAARGVVKKYALRTHRNETHEVAAVLQQMAPGAGVEIGVTALGAASFHDQPPVTVRVSPASASLS